MSEERDDDAEDDSEDIEVEHPGVDATASTAAVIEDRVVILPTISPLPGYVYSWVDLRRREIPPDWKPAMLFDVAGIENYDGQGPDHSVRVGTMALTYRIKDDHLQAQARAAQEILDKLPGNNPRYEPAEVDDLEAAMAVLAQRFKLVPFDPEHFGLGKDGWFDPKSPIPPGQFDYRGIPAPIVITTDPEVLFLTKRRAVIDWLSRVLEATAGCSTIYWRINPEMLEATARLDGAAGFASITYRIYSRFSTA